MTFGPGSIVAGRYHADRLVGTGGMGEVWAGEHVTVGNKVALKRLLPAAAQHHEVVTRFRREAVLLGRIRSDHVARVVDFIDDQVFGPVLVMEFIEGPSLAQILEDRAISVEEAVELASDLANALCDLHDAKIVHRDLKPGNIIMQPQPGARARAVIVDFGIGRQLAAKGAPEEVTGITRANIALGTVEYMAPEQILNSRDVTPVSDVYAVGAILYRSVAGVHAFGSRRGEELARAKLIDEAPRLNVGRNDEVGRGLSDLVARALKKRPAHRFGSAAELRDAVHVILERMQIDELDLESTTADTRLFPIAKEAPPPTPLLPSPAPSRPRPPSPQPHTQTPTRRTLPSIPEPQQSIADQRVSIPAIGDVRGSMPSISEARPSVRDSMPSIPEPRPSNQQMQVGNHRQSMPSINDFGNGAFDNSPGSARASMASLPDSLPRPSRLDSVPPPGVGKKTVALAVLTAFAVGAALGLVLAPTTPQRLGLLSPNPDPTGSAACSCEAKAPSAPPASIKPSDSEPAASAPSGAASSREGYDKPSVVASSGPATNATALPAVSAPKPVLTGKLPDSKWVPPTATGNSSTDTPAHPPQPSGTVDMSGI